MHCVNLGTHAADFDGPSLKRLKSFPRAVLLTAKVGTPGLNDGTDAAALRGNAHGVPHAAQRAHKRVTAASQPRSDSKSGAATTGELDFLNNVLGDPAGVQSVGTCVGQRCQPGGEAGGLMTVPRALPTRPRSERRRPLQGQ